MVILFVIRPLKDVFGEFYQGKADGNEMSRYHGKWTVRDAIMICDRDPECGGFSFQGPKTVLDVRFDTIFLRHVNRDGIRNNKILLSIFIL